MTLQEQTCNAVADLDQPILDIVNDDDLWEALLMRITLPASSAEVLDVLRAMAQDAVELERLYNL
jgi:hypothetical protein